MYTLKKNIEKDKQQFADTLPGEFPFRRGIYPEMYRKKLWTMRQYSGFASANEANKRFLELISSGATGLSVAFDLPTQMGLDPDNSLSRGEVGRVGVSISTLEDMRKLLDQIPLEQISISMTINATAPILLAMLVLVAKERGIDLGKLSGTLQNDILKEHIARGTQFLPLADGLKLSLDVIEYCAKNLPKFYPISVSGYHMREAGASAVDELAFSFSNAIVYLEEAKKRGLELENLLPKFSFFFSADKDFLEEIAKFRAARCLWARLLERRFAIKDKSKCALKFHVQTAGSALTLAEPLNNITRASLQSLAAVLGGCQSLHTSSYDEAYGLPTSASAKQSLCIQQILACESGVTNVVDPFGGSEFMENLTDKIIAEVEQRILEIDKLGGMLKAIEQGFPQDAISSAAYAYQRELESGKKKIVSSAGVKADQQISPYILDSEFEEKRLIEFKKEKSFRSPKDVQTSVNNLGRYLKDETNCVQGLIDALEKGLTLGEIANLFRGIDY